MTLYEAKVEAARLRESERRLQAENAQLQAMILQMAERIAICSELLGKAAERRKKKAATGCWLADRHLSRRCEHEGT